MSMNSKPKMVGPTEKQKASLS